MDIDQQHPPAAAPVVVRGITLRSALVLILRDANRPMPVATLCDALQHRGLRPPGRPSKAVSDALRWEVGRGRVRRVARGQYAVGYVARQTAWRMRRRITAARDASKPDPTRRVPTPSGEPTRRQADPG